ncbi:BRCT domain,Zinc finger, DBF-type [Cinara cedri]|uniref:BRCT domain,Zinc finger, DBF-type n=1 Tax=Cinara cedri TaxID=506608 RepID=A0A5E4N2N1_9HEMI|nr:BRCT domain,Zinc finger, DBF-type [Cinara cedri]
MSMENHHDRLPSADHLDPSNKNKRSILLNKSFLIDIVDKKVTSKVEKLIHLYGGKVLQALEKNTDYLISDYVQHNLEMSNCKSEIEVQNMLSSRQENSADIVKKAKLFNIHILTAKKFQHWLKSLLKKYRQNKNSTDKIANVLRGKVSLKIESLDQGQCPVFEFIPKWPDLGDTLCKKKPNIPTQNNFNRENEIDDEYSSDQYSTSEVGGMCELCDVPFMNYKEHINTKIHIRESLDDNKFHELDELINQRPLNSIFNQFTPEKKISEVKHLIHEKTNVKSYTEATEEIINVVDTDSDDNDIKTRLCSVSDNPGTFEKQTICFKRQYSATDITFVPQKRPSNLQLTSDEETSYHKKTKRKHKTHQKSLSKHIYKVEVVEPNQILPKSKNTNKPPVVIRLKRVQHNENKYCSSDFNTDCLKDTSSLENHIPNHKFIRVVRKPSIYNDNNIRPVTKSFSNNHIFTFEYPELRRFIQKEKLYHPISVNIPDTQSSVKYIDERISKQDNHNLKCAMSFSKSIKFILNMKPQQIGAWFFNIPKEIEDDYSFDSAVLTPLTTKSNTTSI